MYLNPFWVGVAVTILAELALTIGAGILIWAKENKKNK